MYGRITNDMIEYAPSVFTTPEGNKIINFNKSVELMLLYGFRKVEDIIPAYDPKTQEAVYSGYSIIDNTIVLNYSIVEKPIEDELTLEERVSELEAIISAQTSIIEDAINE